MEKSKEFLYIELANKIENYIIKHKLLPGDKIPSIRETKKLFIVSISTIMQAYDLLVGKGIIIGKERYGFFVNTIVKNVLDENNSLYQSLPLNVEVNEMATKMMINAKKFTIASFSILAPSPTLLPVLALNKFVSKSLNNHANAAFGYPLIEGSELLLKQISRLTATWENSISESELLVTNGSLEGINLCLKAITKPGDTVIIESPTYQGILQALENHQLKAIEIPCSPNDGINLDVLSDVIKKEDIAACILMPRLNNPLGCSMSEDNKKRLVSIITENKIPVIEDDTLGALVFDFNTNFPIKAYDNEGFVLYCSSFSKTLSPGFRIGFVCGGKFQKALKKIKFATNIATSGILQDAIGMYLETRKYENHLSKMRLEIQKNLFKYIQSITNYFPENIKISSPAGGLSLWIELPINNNTIELQRIALENNIGICPGTIFTISNEYNNFIRLNYGPMWTNKIDNYIKQLGNLIAD